MRDVDLVNIALANVTNRFSNGSFVLLARHVADDVAFRNETFAGWPVIHRVIDGGSPEFQLFCGPTFAARAVAIQSSRNDRGATKMMVKHDDA